MLTEQYYQEEYLQKLLYNETITMLQYVTHHSNEMTAAFESYCDSNNREQDEQAAHDFIEEILDEEVNAHTPYID